MIRTGSPGILLQGQKTQDTMERNKKNRNESREAYSEKKQAFVMQKSHITKGFD